jgi:putative ATPase
MENLFAARAGGGAPLAERLRPKTLDDFIGQENLVGEGSLLRSALARDEIPSMIFWGPPGSGKTTLAHIVATLTSANFVQLSAVSSGKKELREVLDKAAKDREFYEQRTILFIDEIHRWNKAQQDALLPAVEKGAVVLIGATTENPSFEVISALLSRCQVFVLKPLSTEQLVTILQRGATALGVQADSELLQYIAVLANGDARTALNTLEFAASSGQAISKESIQAAVQKTFLYDKQGEEHFNLISALHKSMRASDPDAALYWMARMLESGDDPLYVARRVIRFASEDVGNEKPTGLVLAVAAYQACHYLGMPECNLALAQAVEYLATAPKSRRLDDAYAAIQRDLADYPNEPVPMHLRNAPTKLMKELGYGQREQEANLPANLAGRRYVDDSDNG